MGKHPRKKVKSLKQSRRQTPSWKKEYNEDIIATASEDEHGATKEDILREVIKSNNLYQLRLLALSDGGFLNDNELRRTCWKKLLDIQQAIELEENVKAETPLSSALQRQIEVDVARSYGNIVRAAEKRSRLKTFLHLFFRRNPHLHYYQGFHDICMVVLDIFEKDTKQVQLLVMEVLAENYFFSDPLHLDFSVIEASLRTIQELINLAEPEYGKILSQIPPYWGTSMLLTCFAHSIELPAPLHRIFDAVISLPPYFSLYLVASLALLPAVRKEALEIHHRSSTNIDEDIMNLHSLLQEQAKQIRTVKDADQLVRIARELVENFPPSQVLIQGENYCGLSRASHLFSPFKFDNSWLPPPPCPIVKKKHPGPANIINTTLWFKLLNSDPAYYYFTAFFVALLAAGSYYKSYI